MNYKTSQLVSSLATLQLVRKGTNHLSLIGNHMPGGGQNLRPSDFIHAQPAFQQSPHHMYPVIREGVVVFAEAIDDARNHARPADGLDVCFYELTQLLGNGSCGMAEWEGHCGIEVLEDAYADHGENFVEFMLRVGAIGVVLASERGREDVGSEVDLHEFRGSA